ncbi:armadillo-type protein [Halteromyces radiatus]|uniref:armadillo-type protein n=1 Tax=Halteromyces radiatus TaxID=101107 RepID=UPI0022202AAE|nr:armadillo-type protein [Halteromyces radiatus]KAI8092662.1 armadillo-type protein [Halteromyces radiatus]
MARNAFKRLRTLRHPDLLKYLDGVENEQAIMFVTDPVEPLSNQLGQDPDQNLVLWGLYKIANAIKFLNNDCSLIHGNIRTSSIFTTKAGEWKLGGLELLSSMKEESPMILTFGGLVPDAQKYAPPEIKQSSWSNVKDLPITAVDSYQLGCLIYEVYNRQFNSADQLLHQTGNIPTSMIRIYKSLLQTSPRSRSDADSFLDEGIRSSKNNGYFAVDFIRVNLFLENISIKEQGEKEAFFRKLDTVVGQFPNEFAMYKILPELVNAFEFGSGGAKALNAIMKIGEHLPDDEFDKVLVTPILRMFASPDRAIRVSLLENMPKFIDHIPDKVVCAQVFPHVATGFTDTVPIIREQTIKAILQLVPKLSERIINYDLLKYLAKLQMDQEPGIRTNTTICLGKMAKNLSDATRKKVLLPAFTRSLRDGFHHARIAALMALNATAEYYTPEECSQRVVPAISMVLLDKEKPVRIQAFKTMSSFIKKLEEEAENMADTALEPVTPVKDSSTTSESLTSSNPSTPGVSMFGGATKGLADWAVSSITRFGTPNGEIEPAAVTPVSRPMDDNSSRPSSIGFSDRLTMEETNSLDGWDEDTSFSDQKNDLLDMNDGWEPFDVTPQEPIKAEPITSIIPTNNHASSISSFGSPTPYRSSKNDSPRQSMKLGHKQPPSLAQALNLDEENSYTPPTSTATTSNHTDRKAELERKREERRQRMAELREKKKSGIGAKKV